MRPILWGTLWFVIGFIGWIILSVIMGAGEGISDTSAPPILIVLLYIFGMMFYLSLPIAIIAEIICWVKRKKKKKKRIEK